MEIDQNSSPVLTTMTGSTMSVKIQLQKLNPRPLPDNEFDCDPFGNAVLQVDSPALRSQEENSDDVEIISNTSDNLSDLYDDRTGNNYDGCNANMLRFPNDIPANTRTVTLDSNNISSIPESFLSKAEIPPLIILSIAHNKLRYLPSNLAVLQPTLKYLNISHNLLDRLPNSVTQLTNLRTLMIDHNNFTAVPLQLAELTNLNELGLDWFTYTGTTDGVLRRKRGLDGFLDALKKLKTEKNKENMMTFGEYMQIFTGRKDWIHQKYCTKRAIPGISAQDDLTFSSIMHKAVISNDFGVLKDVLNYLKKQDIYLEWQDIDGFTPFAAALECGHVTLARMLLNHGINLKIKQKDDTGMVKSGLLVAVERGLTQIVKEMLNLGADPNEVDFNGNSALHLIFAGMSSNIPRYIEILQILLSHDEIKINQTNNAGFTPLHAAVSANQICSIQFALDFNNGTNSAIDHTMIPQNAKFDFKMKNAEGLNVGEMAFGENALEIMEALILSHEEYLEDIDQVKLGHDRFSLTLHKSLAKMRAKYDRKQVQSMRKIPTIIITEKQQEKQENKSGKQGKSRTLSKQSNTSTKSFDSNTSQPATFDVLEAQQKLVDSDELLSKRFKQINPLLLLQQAPAALQPLCEDVSGPHSVLRSLLNYQLLSYETLGNEDKLLFQGLICATVHEKNDYLLDLIAEISTLHPISLGKGRDLYRLELFQAAVRRLLKVGRWPFTILKRRLSLKEWSVAARYIHTEPAEEDQMFEGRYNQRYETQIC